MWVWKDYRVWMLRKARLHNRPEYSVFFAERDIWNCYVGENIGYEQDGRGEDFLRPVVIIRKFNSQMFWGIPLTGTIKNMPMYYVFTPVRKDGFPGRTSSAVLSQMRPMDVRRLRYKSGHISKADFDRLKQKFKALLP